MITKGKWEQSHIRPWEIWVGADIHIADVYGKQETRQSNARLIASAPKLLDACKLMVELYYPGEDKQNYPGESIKKAEQAIAEAEAK